MKHSAVFHTFYQDLSLDIKDKLAKIKLVVFDVDGSITDGSIILDRNDNEFKNFNCKDGMGISLLLKAGIEVALLTGRTSNLTARRAKELRIPHVIQGKMEKEGPLLELLQKLNLQKDDVAVLGDDINDLPLFKHAGVSASPLDGYNYMRQIATIKLTQKGGHGAARELADLILMSKGLIHEDGYPAFIYEQNLALTSIVQ